MAEGKLQDKKFFIADRILAKHDENYMPPELNNIMRENVKSYWKFSSINKYFTQQFNYLFFFKLFKNST